jgi:hypothetical protein
VNGHPTRYRVTCGQHDEPPAIASFRDRIKLLIVAPQFPHDAGLASVPYTGRKLMRKFLSPRIEPARIPYRRSEAWCLRPRGYGAGLPIQNSLQSLFVLLKINFPFGYYLFMILFFRLRYKRCDKLTRQHDTTFCAILCICSKGSPNFYKLIQRSLLPRRETRVLCRCCNPASLFSTVCITELTETVAEISNTF